MAIKLIIYSLCFVLFGGYALLALYLLFHGTYIHCREARQVRESRTLVKRSDYVAKRSEEDVFVYRQKEFAKYNQASNSW